MARCACTYFTHQSDAYPAACVCGHGYEEHGEGGASCFHLRPAILCGYAYPDGALCKVPASQPHDHVSVFNQSVSVHVEGDQTVLTVPVDEATAAKLREGVTGPMHLARPSWHVETRLRETLGRPDLAKNLAALLPGTIGAQLCDRLDTLVTQARERAIIDVENQISEGITEARARLTRDAETKRKAVHDERYRGNSRLS